jgi:pyruvyltransferase
LGDPGILANELVGPQEKLWDLGIVPHWQDDKLAERFHRCIPIASSRVVINHFDDPLIAVKKIGSCRRIVTSSLHGLIVADAFGIPRRVEACNKMEKDGGIFKFKDYSASIKTTFTLGEMSSPSRFLVEDVQFSVYDAYQALKEVLR